MSSAPSRFQSTKTDDIRERFERLSNRWKDQSKYLSNTAQMAMLESYQRVIGLGPSVVPLILEELRREPDHWFWALESITEENPVPREFSGDVKAKAKAWIEWGVKNKLIDHDEF